MCEPGSHEMRDPRETDCGRLGVPSRLDGGEGYINIEVLD